MADRRQGSPGPGDEDAQGTAASGDGPAARAGAGPQAPPGDRDARLAAALRANLARRKARSRAAGGTSGPLAHSQGGDAPPDPARPAHDPFQKD